MTLYRTKAQNGLDHYACACGDHVFAFPQDDALAKWRSAQSIHPSLKQALREKGLLVDRPRPPPLPHVIMVSPQDAHFLAERRWRVHRSPARKKARYTVQARVKGRPLHRMILPGAEVVQFVGGSDGTDCRREKLRATTMREVARGRSASVETA